MRPKPAAANKTLADRENSSGAQIIGALEVMQRDVGQLVPYARNARTHSDAQIELIANSIRRFGFNNPVLLDGANGIIAGHGRVLAAQRLGLTKIPAIELSHLQEAEKRAYILADNKLAEQAGWDRQLLAMEVGELDSLGIEPGSLGFDAADLDELFKSAERDPREDEVPELRETSVSRLGDLWQLGSHKLICGDSTDPGTVSRLLSGARPHLMVTDPPYGVGYDPAWRNKALKSHTSRLGRVLNDDRADWREAWNLFPGNVAYIWHGGLHSITVAESLLAEGFELRAQIIWVKGKLVLGRGDYHWQHEPAWYAVRKGTRSDWSGGRSQTTRWEIGSGGQDAETVHSTQKPVECMRRPILNNSQRGQAVYDPFSGSGTTLVAAEATARCCYAVELEPNYVDLIVRRWEKFSGRKAVHEQTGLSLQELANVRAEEPAQ